MNSDITKCNNTECPLKTSCYRATATPNPYRQSYAEFKPYVVEGKDVCGFYYKIEKR